jgi:hypothetical protein
LIACSLDKDSMSKEQNKDGLSVRRLLTRPSIFLISINSSRSMAHAALNLPQMRDHHLWAFLYNGILPRASLLRHSKYSHPNGIISTAGQGLQGREQ